MTAVPAEVSCPLPITAWFSQYVAVASQNVTVPAVTAEPFDTAPVSVTTVPDVTDELDNVNVVVVAVAASVWGTVSGVRIATIAARRAHAERLKWVTEDTGCRTLLRRGQLPK